MASSLTAAQIIDRARVRHPRFTDPSIQDGQIVAELDTRQRSLLLRYGGAVDGLYNTSVTLATSINGMMVGVSAGGTPQYTTTFQDGYAVHLSAGGTPYVDFSEVPVAGDPFGQNGGVPGFPLPVDFVKLVLATVVYSDNRVGPLDIIAEHSRLARTRVATPTAFVSGNRIVPVRPLSKGNGTDVWSSGIAAVQLSYVGFPVIATLKDVVTMPAVLTEAIITGLADALASMTPNMSAADVARFAAAARASEDALSNYSVDVLGSASTQSVIYRG